MNDSNHTRGVRPRGTRMPRPDEPEPRRHAGDGSTPCAIVRSRRRPGIDIHPAAVCIYPKFVAQARRRVHSHGIAVAAVANFPLGTSPLDDVIAEVEQALADGADEIDVVFPFRAYLAGDHLSAGELVQRVSADMSRRRSTVRR